eukprot:GHVR01059032.1.p1 GENE.GHVR01059032.1~~GHVR01059032.1.p1  ORF type:complete len:107 (+),score=8.13 GHVR01059032.1:2212-2532(+)
MELLNAPCVGIRRHPKPSWKSSRKNMNRKKLLIVRRLALVTIIIAMVANSKKLKTIKQFINVFFAKMLLFVRLVSSLEGISSILSFARWVSIRNGEIVRTEKARKN